MYVRKFEAETLEEALKDIKRELGPDAIILKTLTNKGLKGAFKKKKIEITAAISERSYTKKANVDNVLSPEQKETFYSDQSSVISNMIDVHAESSKRSSGSSSKAGVGAYGKASLNKQVKKMGDKIKSGLDDFLGTPVQESNGKGINEVVEDFSFENFAPAPKQLEQKSQPQPQQQVPTRAASPQAPQEMSMMSKNAITKIDELERKLYELSKDVEKFEKKESVGIFQLRQNLRSLDISEKFVRGLIKKTLFELSEDELEDPEVVFEFALREMLATIQVEMPLFSSVQNETPVVTIVLSEAHCGQSSMIKKIAALKENSVIVKNSGDEKSFTDKMFGFEIVQATSMAEIVSESRKAISAGKDVFVDYKVNTSEIDEVKKFTDGLKRSFENVEILICLSSIHTEMYNRKIASKYRCLSDGIIATNLDLCLNFGSMFNLSTDFRSLPYKFFSTGEVVPEDIEAASSERIIAGLFELE